MAIDADIPLCSSCVTGGMQKKPISGNTHTQDPLQKGILKRDKLQPRLAKAWRDADTGSIFEGGGGGGGVELRRLADRSQISQSNARSKALDEIYQMFIPLHLWNPVCKTRKALLQSGSSPTSKI